MTKKLQPQPLSEETIQSTLRLCEILRKTLARAVSEGKAKVVDGKIIWNKNDNNPRTKGNSAR